MAFRQLLPAATTVTESQKPVSVRTPRRRPTKNTTVACQRCRRYKTKCDGADPCSACNKKGYNDCVYDATNSRHELRQRAEALAKEIDRMKAEQKNAQQQASPASASSFSSANSLAPVTPGPDMCGTSAGDVAADTSHDSVCLSNSDQRHPAGPEIVDLVSDLERLAIESSDHATRVALLALVDRHRLRSSSDQKHSTQRGGRAFQYADLPDMQANLTALEKLADLDNLDNLDNLNTLNTLGVNLDRHMDMFDAMTAYGTTDGVEYPNMPANVPMDGHAFASPNATTSSTITDAHPGLPSVLATAFDSYRSQQHGMDFTEHIVESRNDNTANNARDHLAAQQARLASRAEQQNMGICMPFSSAIKANYFSPEVQVTQVRNMAVPSFAVNTCWVPVETIPEGPARWASNTFAGIRQRARWSIRNGMKPERVIGPTSLDSMVEDYACRAGGGSMRDPEKEVNVSDWAQAFVSHFPHLNLADRVACWSILYRVLSWQACPRPDTFADVPVWCRPSVAETFMPHMPILICLAWPELRAFFVERASNVDWVNAVMGSISVSWPHPDDLIFSRDPASGALVMSEMFERWINDFDSWSIHTATAQQVSCINGRAKLRS